MSMSACNAKPPPGHPLHGTLVACHLSADHVELDEPHSWDIEAVAARHERIMSGVNTLHAMFPGRAFLRVDSQLPHPLAVYDVDPETGERAERPYRSWELPAGPWILVTYEDGEKFAIWKQTGQVYRVGPDGAVEDDPLP